MSQTIQQIINTLIADVPGAPITETVDVLKIGSPDQIVTGIVVTFLATYEVIAQAIHQGANFIIAHEPLFYNHLDEVDWLAGNSLYAAKRKLLQDKCAAKLTNGKPISMCAMPLAAGSPKHSSSANLETLPAASPHPETRFVYSYLIRFTGQSPFSHSALDIKTYAMAMLRLPFRSSIKRSMSRRWFDQLPHKHQALDDALEQGALFCNMLAENTARPYLWGCTKSSVREE